MISTAVFGRYARSLADVAFELGEVEAVSSDLATYREVFRAVPDLLVAFDSPAVPRDAKDRVLLELLARYRARKVTGNFLRVLLQHNRIRFFDQIYESYVKNVDERRGIVSAKVTTAVPLSERESAKLRQSLSKATGKIVNLDLQMDPGLLGGLVVQVGSTVYDGSIRKQLAEMRKHLAES
jgi:F-type H+-transporting ATPase subunit delta